MRDVLGKQDRAANFLQTVDNLQKLQQAIAKGIKIDILKIDPPITPNVILGYNEAERQNRFNEIFKVLEKNYKDKREEA